MSSKDPPTPPCGGDQRCNRVCVNARELNCMRDARLKCCKKYCKVVSGPQNASVVFSSLAIFQSTTGVIATFTIAGLPVGVMLTNMGAFSDLYP